MKKLIIMMALMLFALPIVTAAGTGGNIGGGVGVEEPDLIVFQCGERVVLDDEIQPWRISGDGDLLAERNNHYLFEGERYEVEVLVFDKNKIEDVVVDLIMTGQEVCGCVNVSGQCEQVCIEYNDTSINCEESIVNFSLCNARLGEEELPYDPLMMQGFKCTIDILDSEHMYGITEMSVVAESMFGGDGVYDEIARWFLNPVISLSVDGSLDFTDATPGTSSYSSVLIENGAEGGVILDMFITGKDWPSEETDPLGRCWDGSQYVNYLPLASFRYYTENGAFSTRDETATGVCSNGVTDTGYSSVCRDVDDEGYVNIQRQLNSGFEEAMFNEAEIIQAAPIEDGDLGYGANLLTSGSAGMSITFRLELPEPCYGNFASDSDGSIFFWGEAI